MRFYQDTRALFKASTFQKQKQYILSVIEVVAGYGIVVTMI